MIPTRYEYALIFTFTTPNDNKGTYTDRHLVKSDKKLSAQDLTPHIDMQIQAYTEQGYDKVRIQQVVEYTITGKTIYP